MTSRMVNRFSVKVWVYGVDQSGSYVPTNFYGGWNADSLQLGHTTKGKIGAVAGNKVRSAHIPTNISQWVESVRVTRGRRRSLDSFDAGTATVILESSDRRFDPLYTGAWGGGSLTTPKQLFRRGRPIRILLEGSTDGGVTCRYSLFSGFISDIQTDYSPTTASTLNRTVVQCVDAFGLAGAVDRNEADLSYGEGETMGPRVKRWAEAAGLMSESDPLATRGIYYYTRTGSAFSQQPSVLTTSMRYGVCGTDGTHTLQATTLSENALTAMKVAAASEDGWIYCSKDGQIVHKARTSRSVRFTISDTPSGTVDQNVGVDDFFAWTGLADTMTAYGDQRIEFEGMPSIRADTTDVTNYVALARVGGTMRTSVGTTIDEIGRVSYSRTDLQNQTEPDVDTVAQAIIGRHDDINKTIISGVRIRPGIQDMALVAALRLDLTDAVRFYGVTWGIDKTMYTSGIDFEASARDGLAGSVMTLTLTEAD